MAGHYIGGPDDVTIDSEMPFTVTTSIASAQPPTTWTCKLLTLSQIIYLQPPTAGYTLFVVECRNKALSICIQPVKTL